MTSKKDVPRSEMADYCCMDNSIFDVNGSGQTMLEKVLEIALLQNGRGSKFQSFKKHPTKGIILYWVARDKVVPGREDGRVNFLTPPTPAELARQLCDLILDASSWFDLSSLTKWEMNAEHDGSNSMGWRAYREDWGHVDGEWTALIAVKPCFMWHGK